MMDDAAVLDSLFREALAAFDAGDVATLSRLLATQPRLLRDRLGSPGAWLRDKVGGALDGFFRRPYLLWFVAEDPVRNATLPGNIALVARTIVEAARREGVDSLQEQLEVALRLVCWSWIARECGVQIDLIDVLVEAGADLKRRDTVYDATPLGWARYAEQQQKEDSRARAYREIAAYLRERGAKDETAAAP